MTRAETIAVELEELISAAFDDGTLDRDTVRQIIIGPSPGKAVLYVWASDEWNDFGEYAPAKALAAISLADFLDETDATVGRCPGGETARAPEADLEVCALRLSARRTSGLLLEYADPEITAALDQAVESLRRDCQAALRTVARGGRLGQLKALIGLMLQGLSPSNCADLVAFYHPDGAETLWPVHERVQSGISLYPWCALLHAGLRMFYTEGNDDGLPESRTRLYRFDEMFFYQVSKTRVKKVSFRLQGDSNDITVWYGHVHDEWGGPSWKEVDRALVEHFRTRPGLHFDDDGPPSPFDSAAFSRWRTLFFGSRAPNIRGVAAALARHGAIDAAADLAAQMPADHPSRIWVIEGWGEELLKAGRHAEALALFRGMEARYRCRNWREELECLWALGRHADLLSRCEELAASDAKLAPKLVAYQAMACAALGDSDAAQHLLAPVDGKDLRDGHECAWAHAFTLRHRDPKGAETALWQALAAGDRFIGRDERDFTDAPDLLAILRRRRSLTAMIEPQKQEASRLRRPVQAPALELSPQVELARAAEAWTLAAKQARDKKADGTRRDLLAAVDETRLFSGRIDKSAAGDGFLAVKVDSGILVYDIGAPFKPIPAALLYDLDEYGHSVSYLVARGRFLFAATLNALLTFDLSELHHPRLLSHLVFEDDDHSIQSLELHDDVAVIHWNKRALIVDVRDPALPKPIVFWLLDSSASPGNPSSYKISLRVGDELWALSDTACLWRLDISQRNRPKLIAGMRLLSEGGEPLKSIDPVAARHDDGRLVVSTSEELSIFSRTPSKRQARFETAALTSRLEPPMLAWIEARLADFASSRPNERLGVVSLAHSEDKLRLSLDVPRSYASLRSSDIGDQALSFGVDPRDLLAGETKRRLEDPDPFALPDDFKAALRVARALSAALEILSDTVLVRLCESEPFRRIASGRVFLLGSSLRPVISFVDTSRAWKPVRPAIEGRSSRTLGELLDDHEVWPRLERRLRGEPLLWKELLKLAASGHKIAMLMATKLKEIDETAVVEAMETAALAGYGDVQFLAQYKERDHVRATLEKVLREGKVQSRIRAAIALDRCEDDAVIEDVRGLLDDPEGDYSAHELAAEAMDHIDRRLPELLSSLRGWVGRANELDPRLRKIAVHLFRAGHAEPPPVLLRQANEEKRHERYSSAKKSGIQTRDNARGDQREECYAARLWTGKRFAQRVLALRSAGDLEAPLWSPDWEPEPSLASWTYLLQSAWPHLEREGAIDWMVDVLVHHGKPEERYTADRELLMCLLNHYTVNQDLDRIVSLAQMVHQAPPGIFFSVDSGCGREDDEQTHHRMQRLLVNTRVAKSDRLRAAGNFVQARKLAQAALTDAPNDSRALFLDAQLAWHESNDPKLGLECALANFEKALPSETAGRAMILNLAGCACDELKRYPEALLFFQRAHELHDDSTYLANLAEIHYKMGNVGEAVRFASQAAQKGNRSEFNERILREHDGETCVGD